MTVSVPDETIAAIATAPGEGAIGIVRLSGSEAVAIVHGLFVSSGGYDIRVSKRRVYHGLIRSSEKGNLDEVLVQVMRAPHSYTREDVVEINGHGGPGPLQAILECVFEQGARPAQPGEFTRRAFLNGRIDLVQAEAVIDRIRAQTHAALRAAADSASGHLSRTLHQLAHTLADALAQVEAAVDFPEEDLPELVNDALQASLIDARRVMDELLASAETGRFLREGARVAIAGRPNVGKSSLFNALLRDARAIVTAHPGTTRDLIEEVITVGGIPVRLIDTAGLRATEDEIEQLGIDAAHGALRNADAVLFVIDGSEPVHDADRILAEDLAPLEIPVLMVRNKVDLDDAPSPSWSDWFASIVPVSAQTGEGLTVLEDRLAEVLAGGASRSDAYGIVNRAHQRDSLRRAATALDRVLSNYQASPEFLSIDLRDALRALGEITGETTSEDVLDRIFSSFCIGK